MTTEQTTQEIEQQIAEIDAADTDAIYDALLAQEMANAQPVADPSSFNPGERLSENAPEGLVAMQKSITGNNYVTVYNRRTGDPSVIHRNMLPRQLKKTLEDGTLAFTTTDPGFRPPQGSYICWLHADHELRSVADAMGMATCKKSNIPSEYEVELHVRHRHQQEWRSFDARRQRIEREQDREIQRATLEAMQNVAGRAAGVPVEAPVVTEPEPEPVKEPAPASIVPAFSRNCKRCGEHIVAESAAKLNGKMAAHTRYTHPKKKKS